MIPTRGAGPNLSRDIPNELTWTPGSRGESPKLLLWLHHTRTTSHMGYPSPQQEESLGRNLCSKDMCLTR